MLQLEDLIEKLEKAHNLTVELSKKLRVNLINLDDRNKITFA